MKIQTIYRPLLVKLARERARGLVLLNIIRAESWAIATYTKDIWKKIQKKWTNI